MAGALLLRYAGAQGPEAAPVLLADNTPAAVPAESPEFVFVEDSALASVPVLNGSSLPKSTAGTHTSLF